MQPSTPISSAEPRRKHARSRWLRWLATPFRRVWRWYKIQPRTIQIGLFVVLFAGLATGGYYGKSYLKRRATDQAVAAAWSEYNYALGKANLEGLHAALDHVLAVVPDDPTATRFKAMLDRGEADDDTPDLANVLLRHHFGNGRLSEAAREAEKVLAKNPKDWTARCAVAAHALQVLKNPALAEQHLNKLPDPEDPAARANATGLNFVIKLSDAVGRDASSLRRVIVRRLLPVLRGGPAASAPPAIKIDLLECYLATFADPSALGELTDYWAAADKLADSAVSSAAEAGDIVSLARLAAINSQMRGALARLREHNPARLPDERLNPLMKALNERTRRAWQTIREKAPDRVEAYRGLALLALTEENPQGAMLQILDGLQACGPRSELLDLQLQLVSQLGTREHLNHVFESLLKAAQEAKNDPLKWYLVANAAIAMNRREVALEACRIARIIRNDYPPACQVEAYLWMTSGDFIHAREAILPLGETARRTNPGLAQLYARTLAETLWVLIDDEFNAVLETQAKLKSKSFAPSIGFLVGVLEATPSRERAEWVASRAGRLLLDYPTATIANRIRAEALYRLADLEVAVNPMAGPPLWRVNRVADALREFEGLSPTERTQPAVAAAIAALQLKGQGNAASALRTVGALRSVEGSLNSFQLEILGAVLTANDKPADAIRVLERAIRLPRPTTGLRVALAVAYYKNNQLADARTQLEAAENPRGGDSPDRSAREQAELVAAKHMILQGNP